MGTKLLWSGLTCMLAVPEALEAIGLSPDVRIQHRRGAGDAGRGGPPVVQQVTAKRAYWHRQLRRMDAMLGKALTHEPIRRAKDPTWREVWRRLWRGK